MILLILQPAFLLLGLYYLLPQHSLAQLSCVVAIGLACGMILYRQIGNQLGQLPEQNALVKTMLLPSMLMVAVAMEIGNSTVIWLIFVLLYCGMGLICLISNYRWLVRDTFWAGVVSIFAVGLLLVCCVIGTTKFSTDSYSLYELAQSIIQGDFYHVNTIRQYVTYTDYGISFPYLLPTLLAILDACMGFGIYTGILLNIGCAIFTVLLLCHIAKTVCGSYLPGSLVGLMLCFHASYIDEVMAGRSIPVALLLMLLVIYHLIKLPRCSTSEVFLIGLIGGAGMVIRFDFFVLVAYAGFLIFLFSPRKRLAYMGIFLGGICIFTLPWVIYSYSHFGQLWVSDNGGTIFLLETLNPQRFFVPGEEIASIMTDQNGWLTALLDKCLIVAEAIRRCFMSFNGVMAVACIVVGFLFTLLGSRASSRRLDSFMMLYAAIIFAIGKTFSYMIVGYPDVRYHIEVLAILFLFILCWLWTLADDMGYWSGFSLLMISSMIVLRLICATGFAMEHPAILELAYDSKIVLKKDWNEEMIRPSVLHMPPEVEEIAQLIEIPSYDARVFFLAGHPYKFGAYTGIKTYAHISNVNEQRLLYLIEDYIRPNYIYAPAEQQHWLDVLGQTYHLELLSDMVPLYKIDKKEE